MQLFPALCPLNSTRFGIKLEYGCLNLPTPSIHDVTLDCAAEVAVVDKSPKRCLNLCPGCRIIVKSNPPVVTGVQVNQTFLFQSDSIRCKAGV